MARVLIIGDTHCPGMRHGYVEFLQRIADKHAVTRIVHIGDLVDWASISFHTKPAGLRNGMTEYNEALRQVHRIAKAFPKADWLLGNHDSLPERNLDEIGLPRETLRSHNDLWGIDWKVHQRFGTLEIDGVLYSHGETGRGGQDAAWNQAKDQFRSVAIGHYHSNAGAKWWANQEFRIFGLSVGCGIDHDKMRFEYGRKIVKKPILGCGIVIGGKQAIFEPWLLPSR